jgi:hypothetical protein
LLPADPLVLQFDDRSFLPGVSVTNSIGTYNALAYQSFVGVDGTLPSPLSVSLNGLKNRSPPNVIATGLEPALSGQKAQISTLYPDSPVKTFNLHSFFFACVAHTGESAVSAIVPCTVHVEGFVNGKKTVEQQLVYQPKNLLKARMHYADFAASEWCDLDTVTFTVPCELSKALVLDNIDVSAAHAACSARTDRPALVHGAHLCCASGCLSSAPFLASLFLGRAQAVSSGLRPPPAPPPPPPFHCGALQSPRAADAPSQLRSLLIRLYAFSRSRYRVS